MESLLPWVFEFENDVAVNGWDVPVSGEDRADAAAMTNTAHCRAFPVFRAERIEAREVARGDGICILTTPRTEVIHAKISTEGRCAVLSVELWSGEPFESSKSAFAEATMDHVWYADDFRDDCSGFLCARKIRGHDAANAMWPNGLRECGGFSAALCIERNVPMPLGAIRNIPISRCMANENETHDSSYGKNMDTISHRAENVNYRQRPL